MAMATTLGSQPSRRSTLLALAGLGVVAAITAGCGANGTAPGVQVSPNAPKPANSVYREQSPQPRSNDLADKLNARRSETFGSASFGIAHDDVAYTEAYRHAVYLNSANSSGADPANIATAKPVVVFDTGTAYEDLATEPKVPAIGQRWPALYTNNTVMNRILAVAGGTDLTRSIGAATVKEVYVFNGDVDSPADQTTVFRGYPEVLGDAVDSVWYSRLGRASAMRASLRYFGFGHKADVSAASGSFSPPFPLFDGRFLGVASMISAEPAVAASGHWPNDNNTNVNPVGLDVDMGGPNQMSGPPLHFTLPVDEPFRRLDGIQELSLTKVDGLNGNPVPTLVLPGGDNMVVYTNVINQVVSQTTGDGVYGVQGPLAPTLSGVRVSRWDDSGFGFGSVTVTLTAKLDGFVSGDFVDVNIVDNSQSTKGTQTKPDVGTYGSFRITEVNTDLSTITLADTFDGKGSVVQKKTFKADYQFLSVNNLTVDLYRQNSTARSATFRSDLNLRNGELIAVPVAPLEPNTWYRFRYRAQTAFYNSGLITSHFRTNNKGL